MGKNGSKLRVPDPNAASGATVDNNLVAVFSPEFMPSSSSISMDEFEVLREIGHGSFGLVNLVRKKDTGKIYAMKMLDKQTIMDTDAVAQSKAEQVLQNIAGKHPLIVNLRFCFETNSHLCIVLDFVGGGDLFDHLKAVRRFDESRARLYAAEVYVALEYMHSVDIVYRDLKLENVILDTEGHIRLADFGLAKELDSLQRTSTVCGTAEYMAPEVIDTSVAYGVEADWWSYGIFVYVMLFGKYPFSAQSRAELNTMVATKPIVFPESVAVSNQVKNLIRLLLHKDPKKRIGGTVIRDHPWFTGIDWERVGNRGYDPPFKPTLDPEIEALLLTAPNPEFAARASSLRRAKSSSGTRRRDSGASSSSSSSGSHHRRRRRRKRKAKAAAPDPLPSSSSSGRRKRKSKAKAKAKAAAPPAFSASVPSVAPPPITQSAPTSPAASTSASKKRRKRKAKEDAAPSPRPIPPAPIPSIDAQARAAAYSSSGSESASGPAIDPRTGRARRKRKKKHSLPHALSTIDTKSIRLHANVEHAADDFNPAIARPPPTSDFSFSDEIDDDDLYSVFSASADPPAVHLTAPTPAPDGPAAPPPHPRATRPAVYSSYYSDDDDEPSISFSADGALSPPHRPPRATAPPDDIGSSCFSDSYTD